MVSQSERFKAMTLQAVKYRAAPCGPCHLLVRLSLRPHVAVTPFSPITAVTPASDRFSPHPTATSLPTVGPTLSLHVSLPLHPHHPPTAAYPLVYRIENTVFSACSHECSAFLITILKVDHQANIKKLGTLNNAHDGLPGAYFGESAWNG